MAKAKVKEKALKTSGIAAAFEALQNAGFDVNNRATGDTPPIIKLGFDQLNELLVCGGIPRRRYTQLYGEPHQGKTLLAMHIMAMAQREDPDRVCLYMDTENTFDRKWAEMNGVDFSKVMLIQGNTAEIVLSNAIKAMKTGVVGVVIIDTIGQLMEAKGKTAAWKISEDDKQTKADGGKRQVGALQMLIARFCRVASDYMETHDIAVIGVNQMYTKIGVLYGDPMETPGGKSWKFNITIDMHIRRVKHLRDAPTGPVTGLEMAVRIVKNKLGGMASTDDSNHLMFYFGKDGLARAITYGLLDRALRIELITVANATWFTWESDGKVVRKWQGRVRAIAELMNDEDLRAQLLQEIEEQEKTVKNGSGPGKGVQKKSSGEPDSDELPED